MYMPSVRCPLPRLLPVSLPQLQGVPGHRRLRAYILYIGMGASGPCAQNGPPGGLAREAGGRPGQRGREKGGLTR